MNVAIIGAGFSSLTAACYMAQAGHKVTVYEKNASAGGRAAKLEYQGFTFDMGPTWYWMPGVFERFFNDFGKSPSDFYKLIKLNPAYKVYFSPFDTITIGDNLEQISNNFEKLEMGAGNELKKFIAQAKRNYEIAIDDLVYNPGDSILELITKETIKRIPLFFKSISADIRSRFKHPHLIQLLEFPVLFLGAKPENTPAFYNFMNYADFGLGTYYPEGGMYSVVSGFENLAKSLGVQFSFNSTIQKINTLNDKVISITCNEVDQETDLVISGADYVHTESLLPEKYKNYNASYWKKKVFSPSALLFYVGFSKKIQHIEHHTLFFDVPFAPHAETIYDTKSWPDSPLFYASFPSKTDASAAPDGSESAIFLIPIAPGIEDTDEIRVKYFNSIIKRLETLTQQKLESDILFYKSFCINDFIAHYNSYAGNAYGLANTLLQTHILRPGISNKRLTNLYYTGQLTLPGPGVPPAIISGKIVSQKILKNYKL